MNEATNGMPGGAGEAPVSQPQTTQATPQTPEAPAFDISTLDAELKATGALFGQEDWNHANARERLVKLRTTFSKQGQELNKLKELEPLRPFWQRMSEDDVFRAHMEEAVRSYQGNSAQMSPNQSAPTDISFDPRDARLNQLETVLRTQQINAELDSMAARGNPLNDDMREAVRQSVLSNPNVGTTENHYWMLFGPHIAQLRAQEAARASAEAIKVNNESFVQAPTRTAPPQVKVDVGSLSHSDEVNLVAKILGSR